MADYSVSAEVALDDKASDKLDEIGSAARRTSEELEAQGLEPAHPTALARLIAAGTVWIEDSAIVGRASDGIAVQIGTVDTMEATERYLADHPNPSDW